MSFNFFFKKINWLTVLLLIALANESAFATDWRETLPDAKLVGQGQLRWFGLKIYTAHLWAQRLPFDRHAPFALELTYHRHISGERFVKASSEEIQRLFGQQFSADKLHDWESQMSRAFPDVNDGDELVGIFIPNQGCRFYDNKKLLAEINDPEFAEAFFSIWLDPRTKDTELRAQLLGTKK